MIEIRVYGKLRKSLGKTSVFIETGQEKMTLRKLIAKLPCKEEMVKKSTAFILVNGKNCIFIGGMEAKVKDNDVIDLLPPVDGG